MNNLPPMPTAAHVTSPFDDKPALVPNTSMLPDTEPRNTTHGDTHALADRMCAMRDQWVESTRSHVQYSPLTSLAAAAVLGALIARVLRR